MMIEVPLWSLIVFGIAFLLMLIHTIFGDLLGKALWNYLKWKEKKDEKKGEDKDVSN